MHRATPTARVAVLLVLAFAATAPQSPPVFVSQARAVPLPSFCTGVPIPGGRLNIVRDGTYIILDAPSNTIVGEGHCPRHNGSR